MSEGAQVLQFRHTERAVPAPYHYTACGLDALDDVVEAERPFEAAPDGWRMARGAGTMRPGSGPTGGFAG